MHLFELRSRCRSMLLMTLQVPKASYLVDKIASDEEHHDKDEY